jgi:hypothetical protein
MEMAMTSMPPKTVCPPITGEQLREIARRGLMADQLSPPGFKHKGSPDAVDANGMTKRHVYEAICSRNEKYFDGLAQAWNSNTWHRQTWSKRQYRRNGNKVRPIDVPSEDARLYATWVRYHLSKLVAERDYMAPTVIAYRDFEELHGFGGRPTGFTSQDAFASTVCQLIVQHGPWALSLDQQDGYGNLPHAAIHEALRELGVNHKDRRRIVELVRIKTVRPDGTRLKPLGYGIEQGGPLSPLIFNVVMSMIIRRLEAQGFPAACFGDDLVIVAPSNTAAHRGFATYKAITEPLGYKNTRPIGGGRKATRIVDTTVDVLELIKTYRIGLSLIALTQDKEAELKDRLPALASLATVRKMNRWKVVSKAYLKTLLHGNCPVEIEKPLGEEPKAPAVGQPVADSWVELHLQGEVDGDMEVDDPCVQDDQSTVYRDVPLYVDGMEGRMTCGDVVPIGSLLTSLHNPLGVVTLESTTIPTSPGTGPDQAGGIPNGRSPVPRDSSEVRVQPDRNDGEGSGHRPSPSNTVLPVGIEDIDALRQGRRLRVGDYYRGHVVDLRDVHGELGAGRLGHAVQQLARAASVHGRARFLVHPGDDWEGALAGVHVLRTEPRADGVALTVRRQERTDEAQARTNRRQQLPHPPDTDIIVQRARRDRHDLRRWHVGLLEGSDSKTMSVQVTCRGRTVAKVEALAGVLVVAANGTVAIPADEFLLQHLLGNTTIRQVGLADAVAILRQWEWERRCGWLLGR